MREQLLDFLKKEIIGPDPVSPYIQDNGEEILINEPPRLRYGAGILFPQATLIQEMDSTDKSETTALDVAAATENNTPPDMGEGDREYSSGGSDDEASDDTLTLANNFLPSAMGFSCFCAIPAAGLIVKIRVGRYREEEAVAKDREGNLLTDKAGNPRMRKEFHREPLDTEITISPTELPTPTHRARQFKVLKDGQPTGLELDIRNRTSKKDPDTDSQFFTFSLINRQESSSAINKACFFQVEFSVRAQDDSACFLPYPVRKSVSNIEDEQSVRLLYRKYKTFAIGHGCAPTWKDADNDKATEIIAEVIPAYELKSILPREFDDLQLRMYDFSDYGNPVLLVTNLSKLCEKYEQWIIEQENTADTKLVDNLAELHDTAKRHLNNCRTCLNRMRDGIALLESNSAAQKAFRLMNRAMLMQQLRYSLKLREWQFEKGNEPFVEKRDYPDIHKPETWPRPGLGTWRPFQIAFILMNLKSMVHSECDERKIVDLIWFPTGGGKTEAYLGLTAFTIFLKRLRDKTDIGTTVLMRYTLRLLTAQQFQRAASLICACDLIRQENQDEFGKDRITIGLWVGQGSTPNTQEDAIKAFRVMNQGKTRENPFIILKCPWCGVQMGPVSDGKIIKMRGYEDTRRPATVIFRCHNFDCDFSDRDFSLPLLVIDEDIYASPPTLLIGTVDKFALLPWKPEIASLFGFREGEQQVSPPELIIQDELHLISGPLGSVVGHYETLIGELCINKLVTPPVKAKIIASTATISRAKEQGHALYNCGKENVFQFPPQALEAGESFFAYQDKEAIGRLYVGVHASGLPSHATTQVRVLSALLQGAKSIPVTTEKNRDPYWTVLTYFNSLRELGHAETLIHADIREYLNAMWIRKGIQKIESHDPRRFINHDIELTSRIFSNKIPEHLQELEASYPDNDYPVDVCLATNMISVGVDVPRLGLMAVIGQPKTTSEYIQATSRVGRSKEGPGLVVVIYNTSKPRDRSHYEHFHSYHATIYSQVEPTSVTPFSAPVRERALHALLVAFVRCLSQRNQASPQPFPDDQLLDEIEEIIKNRVDGVDPEELDLTLKRLNERLDEWSRFLPPKYGGFGPPTSDLPLMHPAGVTPLVEWDGKSWPTLGSMRDVDASCEAGVIGKYPAPNEEG